MRWGNTQTAALAEGENFGDLGDAVFDRLLCRAFLREYSRCISCFRVSQMEGVGGRDVVVVGVVGVVVDEVVAVAGVRAFGGVVAHFVLLSCLRSLNNRRISCRWRGTDLRWVL